MKSSKKFLKIIFGLFTVLILWYLLSWWINKPILPLPHVAFKEFCIIFLPSGLWWHFLVSSYRVVMSLIIATGIAVPLGLLLGQEENFDRLFSPIIYILYPIPKVVFLPIILILMGMGNGSKIFLVGLIIFFQILVTTRDAAKGVPVQSLISMKSLGAGKLQIYTHLIFPNCLPKIFTSLRISLGTAVAVLFLAETYATREGLGYFIMDSMNRVEYGEMFAGILGMSILGLIMYLIVDVLESIFCAWQKY